MTIDDGSGRLSILGQLKTRRTEILQGQHLDLPVPRWADPEIIVRYKPVTHDEIRRAQTTVEKAPKDRRAQVEVNGNCDILIRGCVAIIARIDGQDYSLKPDEPKGDFTTFDSDLAANLGLEEGSTARQVVKALFITDGDILSHAQALVHWSGYKETDADDTLEGE